MRLLVLGGTVFLSRAVAEEAVRRGHDVTCACRGESGSLPDGVTHLAWDRDQPPPADLTAQTYDAVVDVRMSRGSGGELDEDLLDREDRREVLDAFRRLSEECQQLLRLLCAEPPVGYQVVAEATGRPIGSIGPTRQRCLQKLRALLEEVDHA